MDKAGKTCPERFTDYVAAGGDPRKPWGSWGEGKGAYVPCPLDRRPWDEAIVKPTIEAARAGLVDGLNIDQEPYGAYAFDIAGDMLCYCEDCFGAYLQHRGISAEVARGDRYTWLEGRGDLDDYLRRQRDRLAEMFRQIAADIRAVRPHFSFSSYPGFVTNDIRGHWRMEAMALGFQSPSAPFIIVDSVPYWENPDRAWWDGAAEAYRQMGVRHIMGSWDNGQMGGHPETHLGAADLMYELAMASDGYWRWGEHVYGADDWRTFAMAHQKLRRVESRLGDFLFEGEAARHFATIVEQTGDPHLQRAVVSRAWRHGGRTLVRIFNGNTDRPIHVRVRMPRVEGEGPWRLRDPLHDVVFVNDGDADWDADALRHGLVVPIQGRGELFLLLEIAPRRSALRRRQTVPSFAFQMHMPPAEPAEPPPAANGTLGPNAIVYTASEKGGYQGTRAAYSLVTTVTVADADSGKPRHLVHLPGYCRQPRFSPDGRHLAASIYVNGRGQITLINAVDAKRRNLSRNHHCDRSPRFAPDGNSIVFVSDRDGDWNIYTMDLDGSRQRPLTDAPGTDRAPVLSPDGRRVAFISDRDGDFELFTMNADGSDQRVVNRRGGNEYEPLWAADGSWIASTVRINQSRGIQMFDADGGRLRHHALGDATDLVCVRLSPDGTKIAAAFTSFEKSGILLIDLAAGEGGKKVTRLVEVSALRPYSHDWYKTGTASPRWVNRTFSGVSFSPDGKRILYCSDQDGGGTFKLYTVAATGGKPVAVLGAIAPRPVESDWSPR